jgi:hypothetical protein
LREVISKKLEGDCLGTRIMSLRRWFDSTLTNKPNLSSTLTINDGGYWTSQENTLQLTKLCPIKIGKKFQRELILDRSSSRAI